MKQAFPYVRFSSRRQKGGTSIERQEAMIAEWLAVHPDYAVTDQKFKDLAKSGWKGAHIKEGGGFGDLLLSVQNGVIKAGDVVLVEAMDRAGRLPPRAMLDKVISPILDAGVSIITLDDNTEYTSESVDTSQIFLLVAKIQAAHSFSKSLSERVSASYTSRRKLAKENGVTPKRATPTWLTSEGIVREDVAPLIKTAFELYVGGMGKNAIAKRMRESGVKRLAKCVARTVEGWLKNKAVIGKWETLKDKPGHQIFDVYEPIIEPSLFHKAQIRTEKMKTTRPLKTTKHFLVGLVRCGSCGKSYIMQNKDGAPHSMRCHSRSAQLGCENSHIVPKPVMDAIYRYTSARAADEAMAQQQMGVNEKEIVIQEAKLRTLNKECEHLVQMVREFGLNDDNREVYRQALADREAAQNALVILRATADTPVSDFARRWAEQYRAGDLQRDDPQLLASMLRTVDYSITVGADKQITSSHSDVVYRYLGVDRQTDKYKLMSGEKLILVPKIDYPEREPDEPDEPAESAWTDDDYENLRSQYE